MTIGTLLYAIGFAAYGFAGTCGLFLLAMVVITSGEMIVSSTSTASIARLAPEEMRGRYMAITGFSWINPSAIGPLATDLVLENLNPNWVWYACGILGLFATGGYLILYKEALVRLSRNESS